jgi:hypothetical protein
MSFRKSSAVVFASMMAMQGFAASSGLYERLSLNIDNYHYITYRGRPALLIGSGEHYGMLTNLDFDYVAYLDEVQASGLNLVRVSSGMYAD